MALLLAGSWQLSHSNIPVRADFTYRQLLSNSIENRLQSDIELSFFSDEIIDKNHMLF